MVGYIGSMRRLVVVVGIAAMVLAGTACGNDDEGAGDGGTPEAALAGLADAVNNLDDAAAATLVCQKDRDYGTKMADTVAGATEADPKLSGLRYRASAGAVVEKTQTTAIGSLEVTVEGVPDDLSDAGRQYLETSQIAWPLSLQTPQRQLHLIVEDGRWVGCRPAP